MAKSLMKVDKNNMSVENRNYLIENLRKFVEEGDVWRQSGGTTSSQTVKFKELITSF